MWSEMYRNSYIGSLAFVDHGSPKVGKGQYCERSNTFTGCSNVNHLVDYGSFIRVQHLVNGTWRDCQSRDYGWTGFSSGTYQTAAFSGDNPMMVVCEWGFRSVRSTHRSSGMWNDGVIKRRWAYSPAHTRLN